MNYSGYIFRIKSVNSFGDSDYSNETTARTTTFENHPPSIPSSPYPDGSIEHNMEWFTFHWVCEDPDENDKLTFDLYLGNVYPPPLFERGIQTQLYHKEYNSLAGGTKYYWKIIARDRQGASAESPVWSFRTCGGRNRVYLTINNSDHGTTNPPAGIWEFTSDFYSYAIAIPDSFYQFHSWAGNIPDSLQFNNPLYIKLEKNNSISPIFQVAATPTQPKLKSPADSSFVFADDIHLQWHKSQLAERYYTSISTDADFFNIIRTDTIKIDTTLASDHLTDGNKFYWKLTADNTIGQSEASET